jgi:hypothetical protein
MGQTHEISDRGRFAVTTPSQAAIEKEPAKQLVEAATMFNRPFDKLTQTPKSSPN